MEFYFNNLPSSINVSGNFDVNCKLDVSKASLDQIYKGKLKLSFIQHGAKKIISNFLRSRRSLEMETKRYRTQIYADCHRSRTKKSVCIRVYLCPNRIRSNGQSCNRKSRKRIEDALNKTKKLGTASHEQLAQIIEGLDEIIGG